MCFYEKSHLLPGMQIDAIVSFLLKYFELFFSAQLTDVKEVFPPNEDADWFIKVTFLLT